MIFALFIIAVHVASFNVPDRVSGHQPSIAPVSAGPARRSAEPDGSSPPPLSGKGEEHDATRINAPNNQMSHAVGEGFCFPNPPLHR
jgi:hypothetical protein